MLHGQAYLRGTVFCPPGSSYMNRDKRIRVYCTYLQLPFWGCVKYQQQNSVSGEQNMNFSSGEQQTGSWWTEYEL